MEVDPECMAREEKARQELTGVLHAFQNSFHYGVHVCESFRDPRVEYIDTYWDQVQSEAYSISDMYIALGEAGTPVPEGAIRAFHQLARVLERLSKRIDRAVMPGIFKDDA